MFRYVLFVVLVSILAASIAERRDPPPAQPNVMKQWLDFLEPFFFGVAFSPPSRLPFFAIFRMHQVTSTCAYNTWVLFTPTPWAKQSVPLNIRRRLVRSDEFLNDAISYSIYYCLSHELNRTVSSRTTLPQQQLDAFLNVTLSLDYTKTGQQRSFFDPEGVARFVADAVLFETDGDGLNSDGSELTGNGQPFGVFSNFGSHNPPGTQYRRTDCSSLRTINWWQPLLVPKPGGGFIVQDWAVDAGMFSDFKNTFGFNSLYDFLPRPQPLWGTATEPYFLGNFTHTLNVSAGLDDAAKALAEFIALDAPILRLTDVLDALQKAATPLDLAQTIKLSFAVSTSAMNTVAVTAASKRYYQGVRPITVIQCLYANQQVKAWKGPYKGVGYINGSEWSTFFPSASVTPAEPEYPSGQTALCASTAEIMRSFFMSDTFIGGPFVTAEGVSRIEPKITNTNDTRYIPGVTNVPNQGPATIGYSPASNVTITFSTWTDYAERCGLARIYSGIHVPFSIVGGLEQGTKVAAAVWAKANSLFEGNQ